MTATSFVIKYASKLSNIFCTASTTTMYWMVVYMRVYFILRIGLIVKVPKSIDTQISPTFQNYIKFKLKKMTLKY